MYKFKWIGIGIVLGLLVIMLLVASGMPEIQKAKKLPEASRSTMVVIEQGYVSMPSNIPDIYYSLVEIQGMKFLFLSSCSSDGGVSAVQVK